MSKTYKTKFGNRLRWIKRGNKKVKQYFDFKEDKWKNSSFK